MIFNQIGGGTNYILFTYNTPSGINHDYGGTYTLENGEVCINSPNVNFDGSYSYILVGE